MDLIKYGDLPEYLQQIIIRHEDLDLLNAFDFRKLIDEIKETASDLENESKVLFLKAMRDTYIDLNYFQLENSIVPSKDSKFYHPQYKLSAKISGDILKWIDSEIQNLNTSNQLINAKVQSIKEIEPTVAEGLLALKLMQDEGLFPSKEGCKNDSPLNSLISLIMRSTEGSVRSISYGIAAILNPEISKFSQDQIKNRLATLTTIKNVFKKQYDNYLDDTHLTKQKIAKIIERIDNLIMAFQQKQKRL